MDACPTLVEDDQGEVNAVGDYQNYGNRTGPSRQYGQGANGQGWRNDNNAPREPQQGGYNNYNNQSQYQQRGQNYNQIGPSSQSNIKSLEEVVKEMTASTQQLAATVQQNQAKTDGAISELSKQMSQLATTVSELKNEPGRLPSQTIPNPRGNVNAVTLRSGRNLNDATKESASDRIADEEHFNAVRGQIKCPAPAEINCKEPAEEQNAADEDQVTGADHEEVNGPRTVLKCTPSAIPSVENFKSDRSLPFPVQVRASKKHKIDQEVWELFSKVEINIPLLEAIKQIPRYAKFLKELCINRRRSTGIDQELLSKNVSAVIQRKVPPKCGDPGTYTIPCTIGNIHIENCMLDLGASINVLPYSIYSCLRIGPLEPAGLTIQLADRSCKQPEGKIEDVLVQVGELVFHADFYVLKMDSSDPTDHAPILLGRPFLKTSKVKIDCDSGTLSMEVEGEVIRFDIFQAMKHPPDFASVHALDTLDDLVQEVRPEGRADPLELTLENAVYSHEDSYEFAETILDVLSQLEIAEPLTPKYEVNEVRLFKSNVFLPSTMQAPKLELKPLPEHLKYAFLGENNTLPVIIKNGLETDQERRLIEVLSSHKLAIGWTLADIRGISPTVCMHRILLEDGAKTSREPQRRLNPIMMEVVQKEIQKLLDADVIYPISDSQWVSPVHVVPKKT
ncbi:unnamed protein product [Rhodiola kirilowii]